MSDPLIVTQEKRPKPLRVGGFDITVLAGGDATQVYEAFHTRGTPGTGPLPHSHPWDETIFVTTGSITFGIGSQETVAGPGTFLHIPGGTRHWYRFGPEPGEFFSITGGKKAAAMFQALSVLGPEGRAQYGEVSAKHGQSLRVDD